MKAAVKLQTERLILDPLKPSDLEEIYSIARDGRSIEDFQYAAESLEDVKLWLVPSLENPLNLVWVIRRQSNTIGLFDLYFEAEYSDLHEDACRVGYFLDYREQRKGYGTEALTAVARWVFETTDFERIEAGVTLHNKPSARILEKSGFVREKVVVGNWSWRGEVYDSAYYFLSKESFEEPGGCVTD